ncbi:MAG TPA: hypothetical protein VF057_10440 [Thermoanaerobaculia bacterium]
MIVERHYDDETLIGLLGASADAFSDPHLAVCLACSDTLNSYRAIAEVLGEDAAWDLRDLRHEPVPETIASLRAMSARMATGDAAATALVDDLLKKARAQWLAIATTDARYIDTAVVRALVAASEVAEKRSATESFDIAKVAVAIGENVAASSSDSHASQALGAAWRQFGFAAFSAGDYNRAAEGISAARDAFEHCSVGEYELARVDILEALYLSVHERFTDAIAIARRAAKVFSAFGDLQRLASAQMGEAYALMLQLRFREALPILEGIERELGPHVDNDTRARVISNIALCEIELNQIAEGVTHNQIAAAIHEELGNATGAAHVRYQTASLLAAKGHAEAKKRLRTVRDDFQRLGMLHLSVCAGLELAEVLLAEGAYAEAEQLCAAASQQFEESGLSNTTEVLTALMYLREAAQQRKATPRAARHVREYVQKLPREPQLLFAPPRDPFF